MLILLTNIPQSPMAHNRDNEYLLNEKNYLKIKNGISSGIPGIKCKKGYFSSLFGT